MKTIGIFTYRIEGQPPWDPDSIATGVMGSEEAVIYMSKELAALGNQVLVFGDPPAHSLHTREGANPRFVSEAFRLSQPLDVAIAWRSTHLGPLLKQKGLAKKVYLWPHDVLIQPVSAESFDGVFWLSVWQRRQWMELSPQYARFPLIFGNGIEEQQFQPIAPRENPYSCIYGSNYGRGLEILLQIWPYVKARFPRATLDIYYGWKAWTATDAATMRRMKNAIATLDSVQEHGTVGHNELNRAYAKASFWTYPCIRPEVFCISALRAQLSGAIPVILRGSALSETVRHGFSCQRAEEYLPLLLSAMEMAERISLSERQELGRFVLEKYTWKKLAGRWQELFEKHS